MIGPATPFGMLFLGLGVLQIALLLGVCWTDIANRVISNGACIAVAIIGALTRLWLGPLALLESVAIGVALFTILVMLHARGVLGGGDVKLLTALALGRSLSGMIDALTVTAVVGGALALLHLVLRLLPRPTLAPTGAGVIRRVYAAERWRIRRRGPLPYGIAIACGGIATLLTHR